jgi:hypothetical protein
VGGGEPSEVREGNKLRESVSVCVCVCVCAGEKETGKGRCEFDKQMGRRVDSQVGCVRFLR